MIRRLETYCGCGDRNEIGLSVDTAGIVLSCETVQSRLSLSWQRWSNNRRLAPFLAVADAIAARPRGTRPPKPGCGRSCQLSRATSVRRPSRSRLANSSRKSGSPGLAGASNALTQPIARILRPGRMRGCFWSRPSSRQPSKPAEALSPGGGSSSSLASRRVTVLFSSKLRPASSSITEYFTICWARRIMITAKRKPANTW